MKRAHVQLGVLAVVYIGLAIRFTWPIAQDASGTFIVYPESTDVTWVWNTTRFAQEGLGEPQAFYTQHMGYPQGFSILRNENLIVPAWLASVGPNQPYLMMNLMLMLAYVATAWGGLVLARRAGADFWAAAWVGALFAFNAHRSELLAHGHTNLVFTLFLPWGLLAVLSALGLMPRQQRRLGIHTLRWGGLFLLLFVLQVFTALLPAVHLLYAAIGAAGIWIFVVLLRSFPVWIRVVMIVGFSVIGHFVADAISQTPDSVLLEHESNNVQPLQFVVPHFRQTLYASQALLDLNNRLFESDWYSNRVVFLGYALLGGTALVLLGWVRRPVKTMEVVALGLTVFSVLGTLLALTVGEGERENLVWLPNALLHELPGLTDNRAPYRLASLIYLFLALVVALGYRHIPFLMRIPVRIRVSLLCVFCLFSIWEHTPKQFTVMSVRQVPGVFKRLAELPNDGLLNVPFSIVDGTHSFGKHYDFEDIIYAHIHQKKMVNAVLGRIDDSEFELRSSNLFLRYTDSCQIRPAATEVPGILPAMHPVKRAFRALQLGYVTVHPHFRESAFPRNFEGHFADLITQREEVDGWLLYHIRP